MKKSCMLSDSVFGPVQGRTLNPIYKKRRIEIRFTNFLIITPTMVGGEGNFTVFHDFKKQSSGGVL